MSDMTHREFIESVWENVTFVPCGQGTGYIKEAELSLSYFEYTESAAWFSAFEFTNARLEEIRQVKEEIVELGHCKSATLVVSSHFIIDRILAREQAALKELCKGIRPEKLAEMEEQVAALWAENERLKVALWNAVQTREDVFFNDEYVKKCVEHEIELAAAMVASRASADEKGKSA